MSTFMRLIKPDWAKPTLANDEPNPKFIKEFPGPNTYEGYDFSVEFLTQKNTEGYNVYFFPNHPSRDLYKEGVISLAGRHIDTFNYVFVDMDLKDKIYASKEEFLKVVQEFVLKPSMVIDSGNGIHVYWRISDLTRDLYVITQLALINHFNTDPSVFTVLQLMRCPGFLNTKRYNDFVPATIVESLSSGETYSISQIPQELYLKLPQEAVTRGQNHLYKLDGKLKIDLPDFVNLDELPDKFLLFIDDPKNEVAKNLFYSPKESEGDRSKADWRLANILYFAGFNKKETLSVISNTQKALSKGSYRYSYAEATIDKIYTQELNSKFLTVGQMLRTQDLEKNLGQPVKGTYYFDYAVLGNPWRKKELLGLIAGTGVGKTSVTLKWMKDAIENNMENDDVYIFFSLEMSASEIVKKWVNLVGEHSKLADRLYVIDKEHKNGEPREIGLQEIVEDVMEIKRLTGKNIGMLAIDHLSLISRHIDVRKKYKFGIESEADAGWDNIRKLSLGTVATQLKPLVKLLDTFIIVLTQTTKEKGVGDLPISKDGAYGISQYENIMDRIITIWQPLMRIQGQCRTKFLAWQYAKIRNKHELDRIQEQEPKLLTYEMKTGDLNIASLDDFKTFMEFLPKASEAREKVLKKKVDSYSLHSNLGSIQEVVKQDKQ